MEHLQWSFFAKNLSPVPESLFNKVTDRSLSSSGVFCEKGVLKICSKYTGEHPCRNVISIKLLCTLPWVFSVNLLHFFRIPFPQNTCRGLFLYPATSMKERTPTQVFSDEFCEVIKAPFLKNTSRQLFLFYAKIFSQQNSKEPSEKIKNGNSLLEKQRRAKRYLYLHQVFIFYSKISLIFSQLPMKTRVLRNNAIPLRI